MEAVEIRKFNGYTIKVFVDEDAESPRKWSTFGTMLCGHSRYNLGDRQIRGQADINAVLRRKDIKSLPLYLYDHSGITMSTSPFSCPWDSGQVGIIFCTHDEIREEFGPKGRALQHISKKAVSSAFKLMRQEVETYDAFLKGDVYGYVLEDPEGEEIDSCWGFICIGSKGMEYVFETAKENIPQLPLPLEVSE